MGVEVGRSPVRRPTGMPDPGRLARGCGQDGLELGELARLLVGTEPAFGPERDARRIVASIFEKLQPPE